MKKVLCLLALAVGSALLPATPAAAFHGSQAGLDAHCAGTTSSPHVVRNIYVYDQHENQPMAYSTYSSLIHEEITWADNGLRDSHSTFKQHWRFACDQNQFLMFYRPSIEIVGVPVTEDDDGTSTRDDSIDCNEAREYLGEAGYYKTTQRFLYWFDGSISNCGSAGAVDESWKAGELNPPVPHTEAGLDNPHNSVEGHAWYSWRHWDQAGVLDDTAVPMEFYHSIGAVSYNDHGDSHNCDTAWEGYGWPCGYYTNGHTRDYPDALNTGYCLPSPGEWDCHFHDDGHNVPGDDHREIKSTCTSDPIVSGLQTPDFLMDCNRDTYWAVQFTSNNPWLCRHYNLATDSLYLWPRPARPTDCPG